MNRDRRSLRVTSGGSHFDSQASEARAPDALGVGTHTATITVIDPTTNQVDTGGATFYVDAPGTGACV
jgi:hypothetical protein